MAIPHLSLPLLLGNFSPPYSFKKPFSDIQAVSKMETKKSTLYDFVCASVLHLHYIQGKRPEIIFIHVTPEGIAVPKKCVLKKI